MQPSSSRSADPVTREELRVVLADDHQLFRAGLRSLLDAQADVQVVAEVGDGRAAVDAACAETPDVVVMDISMPGMNGVEATSRIKMERPEVRILCLSMHSDSRFVQSMLQAGASGYLLKDCAFEQLVDAIRAVANGQIYVSPGLADSVLEGYRAKVDARPTLAGLTPREREVLQLLAEGHPTSDIGQRLHVSAKTVSTHREHLMQKLGTHSVAGLTKFAIREGLTSAEE